MARAVAQGRLAGHQGTLSTRAHAESESQQGKVTPCYPAGRCIRPWIGRGRVAPRSLFSHQPKLRIEDLNLFAAILNSVYAR